MNPYPTPTEHRIIIVRGQRVMLDADLAEVYGVSTKRLNEQVKRNLGRFPGDFMFRLTTAEKAEVVAKCDHLRGLRYSAHLPFAFTEHGAVMLAAVLNSPSAVKASVMIARAFVHLRHLAFGRREISSRLKELELKVGVHDGDIRRLFDALEELIAEPPTPRRAIGFQPKAAS